MLDIALDFAEHAGFAVLPIGQDCKPGRLTWEGTKSGFLGFHDATRDPDLIRAYWTAYPDANVAAHCGEPSGVFVLDVDVKDSAGQGFDGLADLDRLQTMHGDLPLTWATRTPSGGRHLWFDLPPDRPLTNRVHMRAPDGEGGEWKTGLDVRTFGGGVPLPPSRKPSGPYEWIVSVFGGPLAPAPSWLLDIIDPPLPPRREQQPINVRSLGRTARYVEAAVDKECGDLARMGARSGRNLKLFQAAANLGELVGANLLPQSSAEAALERAAQLNGLWKEDGPHSVRASIKSGLVKGIAHPRELTR